MLFMLTVSQRDKAVLYLNVVKVKAFAKPLLHKSIKGMVHPKIKITSLTLVWLKFCK